jgi:cyanate permease
LSLLKSISDPRILAGSIVYFAQNATGYGVSFFLPTIIKNFGVSNFQTGLLATLPPICAAIGMVSLCYNSDRTLRRREHVALALLLATIGASAGPAS